MRDTFSQLVRLGIIIILAALLLGWADSAFFAPGRITCVQEELPEGHICYSKLRGDWGGRIVWVDARTLSDYEVHPLTFPDNRSFAIRPGPDREKLLDNAMDRLMQAEELHECIVVFCTDECTRADEIAAYLRETGIITAPVFVLEGGWNTLLSHGVVKR